MAITYFHFVNENTDFSEALGLGHRLFHLTFAYVSDLIPIVSVHCVPELHMYKLFESSPEPHGTEYYYHPHFTREKTGVREG